MRQDSEPEVDPTGTMETWAPLVERVRAGDPSGLEELYRLFSKGVRFICGGNWGRRTWKTECTMCF